jgi:hypothetical protein
MSLDLEIKFLNIIWMIGFRELIMEILKLISMRALTHAHTHTHTHTQINC